MTAQLNDLNPLLCYAAMQSRDARFDGAFFVGVTSTGIYCRPVCKVRMPKASNCRFFTHAAVAEGLGFRACKRCRPEAESGSNPTQMRWSSEDASKTLATQALELIDASKGAWSMREVAAKMGISDRHLRRIFTAHWGLPPLRYAQTRQSTKPAQDVRIQLPVQLPYDAPHLLAFFAARAIAGVEHVQGQVLWRTLSCAYGRKTLQGWLAADFQSAPQGCLTVTVSASLVPALVHLVPLLRQTFDVDAPITAIDAALISDFPGTAGQRVPGCFNGFELAVRAVLGQQITVPAARTLCERLVTRFGAPLAPMPGTPDQLFRLFPTAKSIACADAQTLGEMGVVRQRQSALLALALQAQLCEADKADPMSYLKHIQSIHGIGAWTTQYVAMRALRDPDAFPAGDVALQNALKTRLSSPVQSAKATLVASQRWQPWRGYAVLRAWGRLSKHPTHVTKDSA